MSFLSLKDLLPRSVRAAGISDKVQAAQAIEACRRALRELLPPAAARLVEPLYVRDGVLTVSAASPAAAQELRFREAKLLSRCSELCPFPLVRIRYQLRQGNEPT